MKIRPAEYTDISEMLQVKRKLVLSESEEVSTRGGFLLGSDEAGYRLRIAQQHTWVIDDDGVYGFLHCTARPRLAGRNLGSKK